MADADPFAKFGASSTASPPPPPPAPERHESALEQVWGAVGDQVANVGHIFAEGWREQEAAQRQLIGDVERSHLEGVGGGDLDEPMAALQRYRANPHDQAARQAAADAAHHLADRIQARSALPSDLMGAMGGGFAGGVTTAAFGEPAAKLTDPLIRWATGGKYVADPAAQGALIAMAIPFLGEANEARAAQAFARRTGMSEASARMVLQSARKSEAAHAAQATANRAARRLVGKGPGQAALDPGAVRASADAHHSAGVKPTLLDTMGMRGQRIVRSAGAKMGGADEILAQHRESLRAGVSATGSAKARELSEYKESLAQRVAKLQTAQSDLASTQYRKPYAQPIQSDERLFEVLDDPGPKAGMRLAEKVAHARMLKEGEQGVEASRQYAELRAMHGYFDAKAKYERDLSEWQENDGGEFATKPNANARLILEKGSAAAKAKIKAELGWKKTPRPEPPTPPTISAGTIDRILIETRRLARETKSKGLAGGMFDRADMLDHYLDGLPHLQEARGAYKAYARRIEQLEWDGNISTMDPRDFEEMVGKLSEDERKELRHNVAERLASDMGRSASGEQRHSDILDTSYTAQQNLRTLLGKETADAYLKANNLLKKQLRTATLADPTVGSRTTPLANDMAETAGHVALNIATGRWHGAQYRIFNFVMRHMTGMNEAEARQIAEWAVSQDKIEDTLATITEAAKGKAGGAFYFPGLKKVQMPPHIAALISAYAAEHAGAQAMTPPNAGGDDASAAPGGPDPFADFKPVSPGDEKSDAPSDGPGQKPDQGGVPEGAEKLTGLKGDNLQAALDVMGVESGGLQPAAFNPGGGGMGARGIAQWRGDRQAGMGDTLDDQLRHVGAELKGRYAAVIPALEAAPTMTDKYDVWLTMYEGVPRGGPDYMTDLSNLIGREAALQYVQSRGVDVGDDDGMMASPFSMGGIGGSDDKADADLEAAIP